MFAMKLSVAGTGTITSLTLVDGTVYGTWAAVQTAFPTLAGATKACDGTATNYHHGVVGAITVGYEGTCTGDVIRTMCGGADYDFVAANVGPTTVPEDI